MRQLTIVLSLIGSFVVYALVVNLFDALFMFLLFGVLPGRSEQLSANQMLTIYGGATALIVAYALRGRFAVAAKFISLNLPRRSSAS
jgi:hypothetical protein